MLSTIFAGAYQAKQLVQLLRGVILTVAGTVCKGHLHRCVKMGDFDRRGSVFCAQQWVKWDLIQASEMERHYGINATSTCALSALMSALSSGGTPSGAVWRRSA